MSEEIVVKKLGDSLVLPVPSDIELTEGKRYNVTQKDDGTIEFEPTKHVNIFADSEFQDYDFRADLKDIPEATELKPVGKEKLV